MFGTEITRWNPFEDLRAIRTLMDRWPLDRGTDGAPASIENLPLDIYEKDGALVVKAAIPGVKPKDVEISITDDVLRIHAETKEDKEVKRKDYYLREYSTGVLNRSVRLPGNLHTDQAKATFEDGNIILTIPRNGEMKPRTIKVELPTT